MSANIATIDIALTEVLQPSELGKLVDPSARRRCKPGEVIVQVLRDLQG